MDSLTPERVPDATIESRVHEILMEQLGAKPAEFSLAARLVDDLCCDSLDIVELMLAAEDEFGIVVPDSAIDQVKTVGDAIELVKGLAA